MSPKQTASYEEVVTENQVLRDQLDEARGLLNAIRTGGVDTLVIDGSNGRQAYTLEGADHPYRIFVESMNEGAVTIDEGGTIVYANRLFADLIGVPLERTVGTRIQQFVSPPDRPQWEEVTHKAKDHASRGELSLLNEDGQTIPVLLSVDLLPMEPERFYCCVVTDLRGQRIHERLRQNEERLRLALEGADLGSWDVDLSTGTATWSRRHALMHGYEPEGGPFSMELWRRLVHPEDHDRLMEAIERAKRNRTFFSEEHRLYRADTNEMRWLLLNGRFFYDEAGTPVRFSGISLDITDSKRAAETIQHRNRQLELLARTTQRLLLDETTEDELFETIFHDIARLIDAEMFYHYRPSEDPGMLRLHTSGGITEEERTQFAVMRFGDLLCGRVAERRERIIAEDLQHSSVPGSNVLREAGATSYAGFPLVAKGELIGTIAFVSKQHIHVRDSDVQVIQTACDQIATALERRKLNWELREGEERLRKILRQSPAGIVETDAMGRMTLANQRWCDMLGYTEAELLRMSVMDVTDASSLEATQSLLDRLVAGAQEVQIEKNYRRKDGAVLMASSTVSASRGENGTFLGLVAVVLDITARKQAENRLRESEERFRTLADNMSQFAWIADPTGFVSWYNKRWFDYTGTTVEEMQGWGWQKVHHPDHLHRVTEKWRRALETKEGWEDTFPLRAKDGQYRWFLSRAVTIRDGEGKIVRWFGTNTDITELREAEEPLARLAAIVQSSDDAMISVSPGGYIMSWNRGAERLFGYTAEEAIGQSILMVIPPERYEEEPNLLSRIRRGEFVDHYETVRRRKDGTLVDISLTVSPIKDEQGEMIGMSKVARDITERKRQEEELRRWKDELEQRVAERTQELNLSQARLRAMASELNLAEQRERKRLAAELHDHLQQILVFGKLMIGNSKRQLLDTPRVFSLLKKLDDVFSDALTYTRTLVTELSPPVLRDHGLAAGLKWLTEYMTNKHAFAVTVVTPDDSALHLPEDHIILLFQCVRELLINAAKHAGTSAATVRMDERAGRLQIEVRDEGIGFDLAAAAAATGSPTGGISSKFGLFSIQERMRALGGAFAIQSQPGKGTTATLVVPLTTKAQEQPLETDCSGTDRPVAGRADSEARADQTQILQVLLVDDHAMVRQGLRSVLESYADLHVIGEAADGLEAIQLAEARRPHVIVMDLNMPRKNGIEATAHIKSQWPEIAVVGISVNIADENCEAMKRAGAVTVLPKEAAVEQLHETIVRAVATAAP
jgi:PAS domain S-box-containing protein